jgi:hypothetical protein
VPHESPISQSGLLFYNTLFDENAACHVALGRAYETTLKDGTKRPLEELQRDGFNQSLTHVDFMFGSDALDVDGERPDGTPRAGHARGRLGVLTPGLGRASRRAIRGAGSTRRSRALLTTCAGRAGRGRPGTLGP